MQWSTITTASDGTVTYPSNWALPHYYDALTVLFRVENALRMFTYIILKAKCKEQWVGIHVRAVENTPASSIAAIGKQRYQQDQAYGYLGFPAQCPLSHLTINELLDVITADGQWPSFASYFPTNKDMLKTKLIELGNVRNAFAHFRPLRESDVTTVKQNALQMLPRVEKCLVEYLNCQDVVPTNTEDTWYTRLRTLQIQRCPTLFRQSSDGRWVRITLDYIPGQITPVQPKTGFSIVTVHKLVAPAVLQLFPDIRNLCISLTEEPTGHYTGETLRINHRIHLTFDRNILANHIDQLVPAFDALLKQIDNESDLIHNDNLARGELVQTATVYVNYIQKDSNTPGHWEVWTMNMSNETAADAPPEYWGGFKNTAFSDFISNASVFPWMPEPFSKSQYF